MEDMIRTDGGRTVNVWSLFLQYPVLAYLDSEKKQALVGQIVALINQGGLQPPITTANICIGRVYHYDVSLYTESYVLIVLCVCAYYYCFIAFHFLLYF